MVDADDDDGSCRPSAEVTIGTFGLSICERTELEAACHVVVGACTRVNSLQCMFVHHDFDEEPLDQAARANELDAIIIAARLPSWSRLQHCDPTGPRPLRPRAWQWGFPWLEGEGKAAAELDNASVHAMIGLVDNFLGSAGAPRPIVLTAPEDLGRVRRAFPASIWQLRQLKALAKGRQCFRAAFHQCQFGDEPFSRPTGFLSNFRLPSRTCKLGWPTHSAAHEFKYSGPLGPSCKCNGSHQSMLKDGGPYRSPERSLSEGTLRWLAASVLSEIMEDKGVGSSRLREGGPFIRWLHQTGFPNKPMQTAMPPFYPKTSDRALVNLMTPRASSNFDGLAFGPGPTWIPRNLQLHAGQLFIETNRKAVGLMRGNNGKQAPRRRRLRSANSCNRFHVTLSCFSLSHA